MRTARRAGQAWIGALPLLLACGAIGSAHAGPARDRLAAALRGVKDARATFRQTRDAGALGRQIARGTLEFGRGGRARLEYTGAAPMTILIHSDTAWVYQPTQMQVLRSSAAASGVPPLPFLTATPARLDERFEIEERGRNTLVFRPRGGEGLPWTSLTLTLDAARGLPERVVLLMADGTTTVLAFERFRVNPGLPAARFTRAWPAGTPIVSL